MFVGGIVVEDDVDGLLRWNSFLDGVEEADELPTDRTIATVPSPSAVANTIPAHQTCF
jgi:hypothetical protein